MFSLENAPNLVKRLSSRSKNAEQNSFVVLTGGGSAVVG